LVQVGGKAEEMKGNVREHTTGLFSDQEKAKAKGNQAEGRAEHDTAQAKGWVEGDFNYNHPSERHCVSL
jgi:uncharacterized protein YjbJ (UPF0337 family)